MKKNQPKLLLFTITLFWYTQYLHVPLQVVYLNSLTLSSQLIGMIIGVYGVAQLGLRIPVGVGADRNGNHKLFIAIGMLTAGLGAVFRVAMPNGTGFFIANLLSGTASAMWISFMVLYTNYFAKDDQRKAMSQTILANTIGIMLAFISSTVLYHVFGMVYLNAFAILTGATGFFVVLTLDKPEAKEDILSARTLLTVVKNKKLLLFSALALVKQGVQMSTVMSFTSQVIRDLGATTTLVGASTIAFMASSVFFARLASSESFIRRFSRQLLIPLIFGLMMVYCLFMPNSTAVWHVFILQILPGMSNGILFALLTAEAMSEVPQEKKSTAMGYYQAIYAIGMSLFPALSGVIAQNFLMSSAFYFLGAACFIALITSLIYYRKTTA
ncbi:MAG: MFS transporter [Turicibacter sp.]|nr:MFS transporter [Turicibacter sp.]